MKPAVRIRTKWLAAGIAVAGLVVVLFAFDPKTHPFFPACLFHRLTGWHCPGCGATRAAHELLHGNFAAAFRDNALLVCGVVGAAGLLPVRWLRRRGGQTMGWQLRPEWLWLMLAGLIIFGVGRNLPAGDWLAP